MHMISLKCRIVKKKKMVHLCLFFFYVLHIGLSATIGKLKLQLIKKNGTNELICKQEKSRNVENNCMVPGGRREG